MRKQVLSLWFLLGCDLFSLPLRYSKGETEKLKIYQSLHGNDWKKIGEMVSRSSLSVALKFSQISGRKSWSLVPTPVNNPAQNDPGPGHHCPPVC